MVRAVRGQCCISGTSRGPHFRELRMILHGLSDDLHEACRGLSVAGHRFKNRPSESYGQYSRASIDVNMGFPDPAEFAMTRLLFHWHIAQGCLRYANGCTTFARTARALENGPQTFGSSRKKNKMANVGSSHNGCANIGIWPPSHHDVPRTMPDMPQSGK
jgi:hypothetical protein